MTISVQGEIDTAETAAHEAASAATGFDDFGDPMYLEGLRVVLRALHDDQQLAGDALRAAATRGPVVTGLIGRLYAFEGFRANPGYAEATIESPLIVAGVPRTGTTALHQLLAQDERFQGTESWLAHTPMVRPPRAAWHSRPEYRTTRDRAEADRARLQAIHWVAADEVDETNVLLRQTFSGNFSLRGPLPTYDEFFLSRDITPAYAYVRDVLGLIGLSSPDKPWLLKNPSDILALDAVLNVFPDARIVITHRDPLAAIPSVASLLVALRRGTSRYDADPGGIDAAAIARRELRQWKIALDRFEEVKARRPGHFHDVWQRDLIRDPLGVARSIYERFGLELSPVAAGRMQRWADASGGDRHGGHRYALEDFDLAADEIKELYAGYRERYGFA